MTNPPLQQAIELIRSGRGAEARPLLQDLIRADPQNITAWLWYVETCQTQAERIQILQACARFNPGHPQVEKALSFLRSESDSAPETVRTWDPLPYTPPKEAPPVWEYTPPPVPPPEPEPPPRAYAWYEVWGEVLSYRPVEVFEDLLRDPNASAGRAYVWMGVTGLLGALLSVMLRMNAIRRVLENPEFQQIAVGLPELAIYGYFALFLCLVPLLGTLFSVLGLMLNAAIQNFLSRLFGGVGNYAGTAYLLGAISAPISIASSMLGSIPFVNCLTVGLSIYALLLNVRALMAAQQINAIKALGVILLPGILLFFLGCILVAILAPSLGEVLQQILSMATPPAY